MPADAIAMGWNMVRTVNYNSNSWLVIEESNEKALLISKDILEKRPYNDTRFCSAWEESSIRKHLGEYFLLSAEEANRYFPDNAARIAYFRGNPWAWWLRGIGIKNHAAFVGKDGSVSAHGYRVDCAWCGVRPVVWVGTDNLAVESAKKYEEEKC
jgi:hypothetical protein